jgi:aryl-alcohol dehydrogenase
LSFASCKACSICDKGHPAFCESLGKLNFSGLNSSNRHAIHDSKNEPLNGFFFGQSCFAQRAVVNAKSAVKVLSLHYFVFFFQYDL